MTQLEKARDGEITLEMRMVSRAENLDPEDLRDAVAAGKVVIPANPRHPDLVPRAIGRGTRIKVGAGLDLSSGSSPREPDLEHLVAALEAGADAVLDLSDQGDLVATRAALLERCSLPVGSAPVLEAGARSAVGAARSEGIDAELLFEVIREHAEQGVDIVTVPCGVTRRALALLEEQGRLLRTASREGALLVAWMSRTGRENPLLERFDELLEIARGYDVTLALGAGLAAGCLADAGDRAQTEEVVTLGRLVARAREAGVQVMVAGPERVPMHLVRAAIETQKTLCDGAPVFTRGPLVTDVAAGCEHVAGAIGGALAAWAGADLLWNVMPAECLGPEGPEGVRAAVVAARVAAHAADIARGSPPARAREDEMALALGRADRERQAELSLDPAAVRSRISSRS